jgi:uncharacterized protein
MAMTMYTASVPVCIRMLGNLSTFLDKAEAFCIAKKVEPSVLLAARLAPDMLPLSKQIHIACDASKFAVSRIIGIDAPKFDDNETNIAEFKERIAATIAFLKTIKPEQLNGTEDKDVQVPIRGTPMAFKAEAYSRISPWPICGSMCQPPTTSCATMVWSWVRWISWVVSLKLTSFSRDLHARHHNIQRP